MSESAVRYIFRWDLDKTYLRTDFDSVRDLLRTALKGPEERVNVPGADTLLRHLTQHNNAKLTFISGSPEQMRSTLERKFELDGIRPDAFVLKPQLRNIFTGRFRAIRGQVGYKLDTLMRIRRHDATVPEICFGDDAEMDAFIYSLYADLIAGLIDDDDLRDILDVAEVYGDTIESIRRSYVAMEHPGDVRRIFIHLDRRTAPGRFWVFGPRIVPIINYFQAALVLYADAILDAEGVVGVAAGMMQDHDYGMMELANSFQDLTRRGHMQRAAIERLTEDINQGDHGSALPPGFIERLLTRARGLAPRSDSQRQRAWSGPPDYLAVLAADQALHESVKGQKGRKRRGLFGSGL